MTIPATMNAMVLTGHGDLDRLEYRTDWPTPRPGADDVLERGGRYTCSGAIAGPIVSLGLRILYLRDLTFTGSTVPPLVFRDVVRSIEKGEIRPMLAATYPLAELHAAQQAFIDKTHTGNIGVIP